MTSYTVAYRLRSEVLKLGRYETPWINLGNHPTYEEALTFETRFIHDFGTLAETAVLKVMH